MTLTLPIDAEANELLRRSPLALLIGMILDQQFPMERAFIAPYELSRRLGHEPTVQELAGFDPDALIEIFARPPVLHRFPRAMAGRVQEACRIVVEKYGGDVGRIWTDAVDGRDAFRRISALPGFGRQKAQILLALLGKRFEVRPQGWREVAGEFGAENSFRSVADVVDAASLDKVRDFKKQMKAAQRGR